MFKKRKLESRRIEAISAITGERVLVEAMAQRPRNANDPLNQTLVDSVLKCLAELEEKAKRATNADDLDDLSADAERQGQLRGYLCPIVDVQLESEMVFDLLEEWGVRKAATAKLRVCFGEKLSKAESDPDGARGALRALFEERDSWSDYTEEYQTEMEGFTRRLFWCSLVLAPAAVLSFRFAIHFSPLIVLGLVCSGVVGSAVSIMDKMPAIEVGLSSESQAYGRRILSRIGTGAAASLIGSALLGWGLLPISVKNHTFSDALAACSQPGTSCAATDILLLLAIPMLLGFSERALTSFEQSVFGNPKESREK